MNICFCSALLNSQILYTHSTTHNSLKPRFGKKIESAEGRPLTRKSRGGGGAGVCEDGVREKDIGTGEEGRITAERGKNEDGGDREEAI